MAKLLPNRNGSSFRQKCKLFFGPSGDEKGRVTKTNSLYTWVSVSEKYFKMIF